MRNRLYRHNRHLFGEVQVIAEPLPGLDLFNCETWLAICEWREEEEAPEGRGKDDTSGNPASELTGSGNTLANRAGASPAVALLGWGAGGLRVLRLNAEDELNEGTSDQTRREMGRKVVVQEELTTHDVEGNVVSGPGKEEEAGRVVQTRAGAVVKSIHTTAQSQLISAYNASEDGKK